jgi:hypothetical protein
MGERAAVAELGVQILPTNRFNRPAGMNEDDGSSRTPPTTNASIGFPQVPSSTFVSECLRRTIPESYERSDSEHERFKGL